MNHDRFRLTGTTIAHKYAVLAMVEEGGFSVIYRARHLVWDRHVAIKAFKAPQDLSEDQREALVRGFVREGAILAELSERSTAICQSRDIGTLTLESGEWVPYLVLEWLDGECLEFQIHRERERKQPPRSLGAAMVLLAPIAGALALAHRRGISHRDVKPGNLFVLHDGGMKLLDFGIASEASVATPAARRPTRADLRSFTPQYGAPEQFSLGYGPTGSWTDVFALALILIELMTGREPLEGATTDDLASAAMNLRARPTPRRLGLTVGDAVEAVFARALAVEPTRRYASAGEFWTALQHAAEPAAHDAPRVSPHVSQHAIDASDVVDDRTTLPTMAASVPPGGQRAGRRLAGIAAGAAALALITFVAMSPRVRGIAADRFSRAPAASEAAPALPPPPMEPARVAPACPAGTALVPGGKFFMGSDDDSPAEKPAHAVTLSPYCMDVTEVTTAAFKACSDAGECKRAPSSNEWEKISDHERKQLDALCNVRDLAGRGQHPINCVDWEMATGFCAARGGRLPTEAEWEFAARSSDGRAYPWGDFEPNEHLLNACGKECVAFGVKNRIDASPMYWKDDGWVGTAPVASFPLGQSRFGMQDMVGNVWEWVSDKYGPYDREAERDPKGPGSGDERVIRGGAWNAGHPSWVRSSFRHKSPPMTRSHAIGFRCARALGASSEPATP